MVITPETCPLTEISLFIRRTKSLYTNKSNDKRQTPTLTYSTVCFKTQNFDLGRNIMWLKRAIFDKVDYIDIEPVLIENDPK